MFFSRMHAAITLFLPQLQSVSRQGFLLQELKRQSFAVPASQGERLLPLRTKQHKTSGGGSRCKCGGELDAYFEGRASIGAIMHTYFKGKLFADTEETKIL